VAKRNEHRISGELDAESASRSYEKDLRKQFPVLEDPAFDLLLLFVGEDGSVASLFPGSPAFTESERWVLPVRAPSSETTPERITLTPRILNRSREVLLVALGKGRMEIARRVQAGDPAALELPAAKIRGTEGTVWLTTASQAS
jgi:6-phosphogluconolactonase